MWRELEDGHSPGVVKPISDQVPLLPGGDHNGATYQASTAQLWHTTDTGITWSPVTALR